MLIVSNNNDKQRIEIPSTLVFPTVQWYHITLGHVGAHRLYSTISSHFRFPHMKHVIHGCVSQCQQCQRNKITRGYGHLPPKDANVIPWDEVNVDLIGPWIIPIVGHPNVKLSFRALTCIDPATSFTEIIRIDNATQEHVATKFENEWVGRYPRPLRCVHDNGNEFFIWSLYGSLTSEWY
ncbi:MAG: integrase zinc binding domain-containing protein [bacterium]